MEINLRNQIWPEYTRKWFMSKQDSSVPHNYDAANIEANKNIRQYLVDNGLHFSSNWMPDEIFHEHFKRWIGYCSVPQHALEGNTSTQPFFLSFFPFAFEVISAIFLGKFNSYITQPNFLDNGKTMVISDEEPKVAQKCLKGILDNLLGCEDLKFGFVYIVLINDDQSNIDEMRFEENGNFWVRLKIGLQDQAIQNINDKHSLVTSDRAEQIQKLKTNLASADSYIQLDVENTDGSTYLVFKEKANRDINLQKQININPVIVEVPRKPSSYMGTTNEEVLSDSITKETIKINENADSDDIADMIVSAISSGCTLINISYSYDVENLSVTVLGLLRDAIFRSRDLVVNGDSAMVAILVSDIPYESVDTYFLDHPLPEGFALYK